MPFGPYPSFDECVAQNQGKRDPSAYCAAIMRAVEHSVEGQFQNDPVRICEWMWAHGTDSQRGAFGNGTEGRAPGEKPPKAWWDDFLATISSHTAELPLEARKEYALAFEASMKKNRDAFAARATALSTLKTNGWEQTRTGWLKKFQAAKTRSIKGVEVFAAGVWTDSQGQTHEWTAADLEKMVQTFKGGRGFVLKVGHTSDGFNRKVAEALSVPLELVTGEFGLGQIALGQGSDLSLVDGKLVADFTNVPEAIADLIEGHQFNHVSAEIELNDNKPTLTAVALLGVEEPAVNSLAPLAAAGVFSRKAEGMAIVNFKYAKEGHVMQQEEYQQKATMLSRLLAWFGKQQSKEDPMTTPKKFTLTQEDLPKLYAALGLPPEAGIDQIVAAIETFKSGAGAGAGAGGGAPGMMTKEEKQEFESFKSKVTALETENTTLKHEKRVAGYLAIAKNLTAIPGKPDDLAASWTSIEEKIGKPDADKIVAQFQAANKAAQESGFLVATGSSRTDLNPEDEFVKKVNLRASEKKVSFNVALVEIQREDPDGFNAYYARSRSNGVTAQS